MALADAADSELQQQQDLPSTGDAFNTYNSYEQFNPDQFEPNSPEWNMAMIRFLLDMKKHGHHIKEVVADTKVRTITRMFILYVPPNKHTPKCFWMAVRSLVDD